MALHSKPSLSDTAEILFLILAFKRPIQPALKHGCELGNGFMGFSEAKSALKLTQPASERTPASPTLYPLVKTPILIYFLLATELD